MAKPDYCDHCGYPRCLECGGCTNPVEPTCMCIDAKGEMHPTVILGSHEAFGTFDRAGNPVTLYSTDTPNPRITCEETFGGTAA